MAWAPGAPCSHGFFSSTFPETTLLASSAGEPPPVGGFPPRGAHIFKKIRNSILDVVSFLKRMWNSAKISDYQTKFRQNLAQKSAKYSKQLTVFNKKSNLQNMLSQESQKMCLECKVAIKWELLKNFKHLKETFKISKFKCLKNAIYIFKCLNLTTWNKNEI